MTLALQVWLTVFSLMAVYLSQDHRWWRRRWACVFGLVSQPAWFYASWTSEQWGIFVIAIFYTAAWARGFHGYWIKEKTWA
jgi:hypothetical protein